MLLMIMIMMMMKGSQQILFSVYLLSVHQLIRSEAFATSSRVSCRKLFPPQSCLQTQIFRAEGKSILTLFAYGDVILADDEPLSARFQRAVVLQRAGDHDSALKEYQTFVKAAQQCDVSPSMYAEVHVNMGAIYTKLRKRDEARNNFETALNYREIGSAHVNLALLTLADGQLSADPRFGIQALKSAKTHCEMAIELDDDANSVQSASKLLKDIEMMLQQAVGQ